MPHITKVLIVDDSAFVRKVVRQMLSRSPFIEVVGTAANGREALEKVEELKPDVVSLDLIMPELDGIGFLREQMKRRPLPVVVVSIASENGELVLQAMDLGAVDFIQKPTALATDKIFEITDELIEKVKTAALVSPQKIAGLPVEEAALSSAIPIPAKAKGQVEVVVLGISTGGPQALRTLIPRFPAEFPVPVAMVLHMPVGYTELYAKKLDEISRLKVVEAREGDELKPGLALLAPAGRHLFLSRNRNGAVIAHLDTRPFDTPHRPSVDVLFRSAAEVYGDKVLGVVMTGMGSDGKEGASWIKAQGGRIFTEAEETCVVYGMPRSVVEAGLSDKQVPLYNLAKEIMEVV